jgi:hypothetical protein
MERLQVYDCLEHPQIEIGEYFLGYVRRSHKGEVRFETARFGSPVDEERDPFVPVFVGQTEYRNSMCDESVVRIENRLNRMITKFPVLHGWMDK